MTKQVKSQLKQELAACFRNAPNIKKVIVFGSMLASDEPNDIDVAIFIDGDEDYLPTALRLRKLARTVGKRFPLDLIPVKSGATGPMVDEILSGEIIYER